ncbi:ariadne RING finger [Aspergillus flavus]|uniref:Ariadne RING finger n=1 Tax=Aspergillus flavus TaxID=5059 RepID=A0AB74BND1_ASPFL|nr:ariadne RING finger [Aspergillus flavus]RMZ35904.1 ariadne RING finger [Aspergillus flavus]
MRAEDTVKEGDSNLQHLDLSSKKVAYVPRVQEKAQETYRKQHYLESVGPVPCLMSSQKVTSKKERSGYERRPRYKTKDDHYEYKGKTSHEKDGRVTKTKRRRSAKKSRKHTVNDNFHASNVARDRLTLQSKRNLGLFQMGRTSSPVKVQGADLSFSEMKFLSNKARKDREAACFYRDKEENGSASDVLPYEISVYEHGQKSTMPQTYPKASKQHRHEGSDGISRAATAYTWPESAREYSALDDPGEWCARQLLNIDLDVQDENEAIVTVESTRKYWSLEELKCLLDQRKLLWDSDTNSPVASTNERSHWGSRKRKRPQSIGEGEPAQTPKMTKKHNSQNNAEHYGVISIPVTNHHGPASELPALLRNSGDTDGVSMHMLHGQPAPASPQAFEQADIIEPPTSDFTLYPGTSSFISSSLHNQKPKSVIQSHDSCGLKEVKASTASEMIWHYDESPAQFANRAMPLPRDDCALIAQTLSAAYEVIMHSEQDPLYQIPKHLTLDTPMRDASSGVGGNGNISQVADDYHGLPEGLAFYWLPGVASDTGTFSHGSSDFAEQKRSLCLSQPTYAGQLQYFTGQFSEARYSTGETPEVIMAEAEFRPTAAMVSGLQEDLLGGLKGFWRQQKLY